MALHVLVPYDDAEPARAALAHAVTQFPEADVSVLVVSERTDLLSRADGSDESSTADAAAALVSERVEAIRDVAPDSGAGRIETAVRPGAGADEVVDYVEEAAVNHVVVGNGSQSVLSRVLHGSVAERIARHSPVPVTMVDADARTESEGEVKDPVAVRQD